MIYIRIYYTEKEKKDILKSITILIDTKEEEFSHIKNYFEKKKILFQRKNLDVGDYSAMINNPVLGERPVYFDKEIIIERKGSLIELAGNLSNGRTQFENEMLRGINIKKTLLIENENGYNDIKNGEYMLYSKYNSKSYIATLFSMKAKYDLDFHFISKENSGEYIYYMMYYYIRKILNENNI